MVPPPEMLQRLRLLGDPELDPIIAELFSEGAVEQVNRLLKGVTLNGQPLPAEAPAALRDWYARAGRLPAWADREKIDRASNIFVSNGMSIGVLLGLPSLLECFTASLGVRALHATDQMGMSGAAKRVGDTAQFVIHVMRPGALFEGGGGLPVLLKVRLMHAASRRLISQHGWDASLGVPVCQEDLLATLLTFGFTPMDKLPRLGAKVSARDAEDFLHFWRVAGVVLGIPEEIMPTSSAEAKACFEEICRHQMGATKEGIELAKALIGLYEGLMPSTALAGAVSGVARWLAGDEVCDMLEVPATAWTRVLRGTSVVFQLYSGSKTGSRTIKNIIDKLGWAQLTRLSLRFSGGREAEFEIPVELRKAWKLPPAGSRAKAPKVVRRLGTELNERCRGDAGERALQGVAQIAVLVASSHEELDDFELEALVEGIGAMGGNTVGGDELRTRIQNAAQVVATSDLTAIAAEVSAALRPFGAVEGALELGAAMAYARNGIAPEDRKVLASIATAAGISEPEFVATLERARAAIEA